MRTLPRRRLIPRSMVPSCSFHRELGFAVGSTHESVQSLRLSERTLRNARNPSPAAVILKRPMRRVTMDVPTRERFYVSQFIRLDRIRFNRRSETKASKQLFKANGRICL
jgi:hypothetical protein